MKFKNILLGVSGSIAAGFIHEYIRIIQETYQPHKINIIMTETATRFINPGTVKYIINGSVFTDLFEKNEEYKIPHVHLTDQADIFIILPTTANTIGKVANGIADNLLTTSVLAAKCPVIICPNMNEYMLNRKSVQRNLLLLEKDGYKVMETEFATQLSSGRKVKGGLPLPNEFVKQLEGLLEHGRIII